MRSSLLKVQTSYRALLLRNHDTKAQWLTDG